MLTGGPCAGKTTSINRIKHFFENIGWKAFCVAETATVLLSSGIYFSDLDKNTGQFYLIDFSSPTFWVISNLLYKFQAIEFQENLLRTLLQIEDTINKTASYYHNVLNQNCIIIYDRGAMDPVAYVEPDDWELLKQRNPTWNEVDLRDNRYDQVLHLVIVFFKLTITNRSI